MNRKIASTALIVAAFATGSAFAESPLAGGQDNFVPSKTRAEVQAELFAYKQAGVNPWSMSYDPLKSFRSTASRQEVVAGYLADRDAVAAINGEDSGSAYFAQAATQARPGSTTLAGQPARAQ
jgi:hypothetical protein